MTSPPITLAWQRSPAGSQHSLPRLAPAIDRDEADALVRRFSWPTAPVLEETNGDGSPALYYAVLLVRSHDEVARLAELEIHHSSMPLFDHELARWKGQSGILSPTLAGAGVLRFAVLAGEVHNLLRAAALRGEPLFAMVALRRVPRQMRARNGSLSYARLAEAGFRYRGAAGTGTATGNGASAGIATGNGAGAGIGTRRSALLFSGTRRLFDEIADRAAEVGRSIARFFGERDRDGVGGIFAAGAVNLTLTLDILNTDPRFGGTAAPTNGGLPNDGATTMIRTWGRSAGQPVPLPGVKVRLWSQGRLPLPTLFEGTTDALGTVTLRVARGRPVNRLCVEAANFAAYLTEFFGATEVCSFADDTVRPIAFLDRDRQTPVRIQHDYFNLLAQFTEGYSYLRDVVGYRPHQARVLVGPIPDTLGETTVYCFGFPHPAIDAAILTAAGAALLVPVVGPLLAPTLVTAAPVFAVDVLFSAQEHSVSRGTPSHEYGHFALCSMLFDTDPALFVSEYTQAVVEALQSGSETWTRTAAANNEAFADFLSGQIVGAVNYFSPADSTMPQDGHGMQYCFNELADGAVARCLDDNLSATARFGDRVGRLATLLHDVFDGHFPVPGTPPLDLPGNGDVWRLTTDAERQMATDLGLPAPPDIVYAEPRHGDARDECVTLPGSALRELVGRLSSLDEDGFMRALVETMRAHGVPWCAVCQVFAMHTDRDPALTLLDFCTQAPFAGALGPPPAGLTSCNVCPLASGCPTGMPFLHDDQCVASCPDRTEPRCFPSETERCDPLDLICYPIVE